MAKDETRSTTHEQDHHRSSYSEGLLAVDSCVASAAGSSKREKAGATLKKSRSPAPQQITGGAATKKCPIICPAVEPQAEPVSHRHAKDVELFAQGDQLLHIVFVATRLDT